jgi:hypothetical protein
MVNPPYLYTNTKEILMAVQIPIWPGSSSFFPDMTPFGYYDNDYEFQQDADKVASWCAKRLGYPIVDIELQDINFYACFEEAVTEYSSQVNQFNIRENLLNLKGSSDWFKFITNST